MSPARAPPSMDMLQMVMRCSMVSARMAVAGVLEDVTGAAADADAAMRSRMMSLAVTPGAERAVDADLVGLERTLQQRLRGQHHLHLAGADAEGQRAEGAVGGGVGVAADDGHARLGQAQLRADDVDDALPVRAERVERHAELVAVGLQLGQLEAGLLVEDGQRAVVGRRGVIRGGDGALGMAHAQAAASKTLEGLRAGDLVHEVEVDAEDRGSPGLLVDDMVVPDLLDECARRACGARHARSVAERRDASAERRRQGLPRRGRCLA